MFKNKHGHSIVLTSVPHSGTHTVRGILEKAGLNFTFDHLYDGFMPPLRLWMVNGIYCVVPMRHPWKTCLSHKGKGTPFKEVEKFYRNLFYVVHPFRPLYIPVDTPDRDKYLARASHHLGVELKTDWTPLGRTGASERCSLDESEATQLIRFIREFEDVFNIFGYKPEDVKWQ